MAYHLVGTNNYCISTHRTPTAAVKAYRAATARERACLLPSNIRIDEAVANANYDFGCETQFYFDDGSIVNVSMRLDHNNNPIDPELVDVTLLRPAGLPATYYHAQVKANALRAAAIQAQIEAEQAEEDAKLAAHYAAIQAELEQMLQDEREEWEREAPAREAYLAKMDAEEAAKMAAFYAYIASEKGCAV